MARSEALGIQRLEDILFVVNDIERSTRFYVDKLDFALTARSTPDNEAATGERTRVFEAGEVRVTVVQPLTASAPQTSRPASFRVSRSRPAVRGPPWPSSPGRGPS